MFDLHGKVAVVTGGSGGIGKAMAGALSRQGATVVLVGRNGASLAAAATEIAEVSGREVAHASADVTDENSVVNLTTEVVQRHGTVDILINAHGVNVRGKTLDFPMDQWPQLFDINVKGTMHTCRQFGAFMVGKKYGKIVNLSSVRGVRGNANGIGPYCATKAAIDMLTRCMAAEWAPARVNVNALAPALIATKLTEQYVNMPEYADRYTRNIPWGRLGMPDDLVGATLLLVSDAAQFITGQVLYVDGGLTACT